jgi:DNA (cytosine-5)-methyltransferase 1
MMVGKRPIGIDLFAGAGGLSLGFEQAGFDIAAAVEIDPIHCATHHFNFPHTQVICASVENLSGAAIRQKAHLGGADIDVVFGGAPCQGFSMIGKRAFDDPRNHLVTHYVRLVKELSPKFCVFENVKGLTVGRHREFLNELMAALGEAGYQVISPYQVLNAADHGVPQDRHRLFLIGARQDQRAVVYPQANPVRVTVEEAIGDLPNVDDFDGLLESDIVKTQWKTNSHYAKVLRGLVADIGDFSYPRRFDANTLTSSRRTIHTELSRQRFAQTVSGDTEPVSRFRKLALDGRCNTLRAGTDSARGAFTSPRPIHPVWNRVITVREAARLHSYPDWFRLHATKWHGFRQVGNSVPPLLGRAVAGQVMKALGVAPVKPASALVLGDPQRLTLDMSEAAGIFGVPKNTIAQRNRAFESQDIQPPLWEDVNGQSA